MKKIKYFSSLLILFAFALGCDEEKYDDLSSLESATTPSNIQALFDVTTDNSGNVTITPSGEAAGSYKVHFGDSTEEPGIVSAGNNIVHKYAEGEYTVKIEGVATNGASTETSYPLSVVYRVPEELAVTYDKSGYVLTITAKADYANSFLVYFGHVANEVGTPLASGEDVSHDYGEAGAFDVKVIALSGGAAQVEEIAEVTMFDLFLLPITFEEPFVDHKFFPFGGGQQFEKVANPDPSGINTSATVGRFKRGWEEWSGTATILNDSIAFDFAVASKAKIWVYNPDAENIGKNLKFELEDGTIDKGIALLEMPITTSGAWEEVVFDFGPMLEDGTIPAGTTFPRFVLRFNRGTNGDFATLYLDNIRFTND